MKDTNGWILKILAGVAILVLAGVIFAGAGVSGELKVHANQILALEQERKAMPDSLNALRESLDLRLRNVELELAGIGAKMDTMLKDSIHAARREGDRR